MLSKLSEPTEHCDWTDKLSQVEIAFNNSLHSATKQSPAILLFGVEQRGEIVDELTEYLQDRYEDSNRDLKVIREDASESIKKSQENNLKYFHIHHKPPKSFKPGDLVVLKNVNTTPGVNKKLIPKYRGPYIVQKQLGNDRYEISDVENCQVTQLPYRGVVDSTRLRKWLEVKDSVKNKLSETEGNTSEYEDYEFLEDEFLQD